MGNKQTYATKAMPRRLLLRQRHRLDTQLTSIIDSIVVLKISVFMRKYRSGDRSRGNVRLTLRHRRWLAPDLVDFVGGRSLVAVVSSSSIALVVRVGHRSWRPEPVCSAAGQLRQSRRANVITCSGEIGLLSTCQSRQMYVESRSLVHGRARIADRSDSQSGNFKIGGSAVESWSNRIH